MVELRGYSTNYTKAKWEKELGIVIASAEWTNIINTQITTTTSQLWRDFSWKSCNRYLIAPKQKFKQTGEQPKSWRWCDKCVADHTHMFWGCPVLKPFRRGVHSYRQRSSDVLSEMEYDIEFTCLSFYLGNMDLNLTKSDRYLLKIHMSASKKAITRRRLCRDHPTIDQWVAIIKNI